MDVAHSDITDHSQRMMGVLAGDKELDRLLVGRQIDSKGSHG